MKSEDLRVLLDTEAKRINRKEFIDSDPVQFPHRFTDLRDIEIVSFLASIIAWGKRSMICRDAERLLTLMDNEPYRYVMDRAYECLEPKVNIHRTMFGEHLQYFLRGLNAIYSRYNSVDSFAAAHAVGTSEFPSWQLVAAMQAVMRDVNGGSSCSQCLPTDLNKTALKRINMALRWLVRDDGIVDMGVWHSIPKSKLFIPLDVHVGNTARRLGMITRKANDRKTVELLTEELRKMRPDDPVYYDFALFGIGVGE